MRTKKVLLIVLALMGTVLGTAHIAQAAYSDCNSGNVCMWGNNDFQWLIGERAGGSGRVNLSGDANNQMDSWANRSGYYAAGYGFYDGQGDCQTFSPYSYDSNVAPFNSDEVSSWRTNYGC